MVLGFIVWSVVRPRAELGAGVGGLGGCWGEPLVPRAFWRHLRPIAASVPRHRAYLSLGRTDLMYTRIIIHVNLPNVILPLTFLISCTYFCTSR